jgi:hypothetical protein
MLRAVFSHGYFFLVPLAILEGPLPAAPRSGEPYRQDRSRPILDDVEHWSGPSSP